MDTRNYDKKYPKSFDDCDCDEDNNCGCSFPNNISEFSCDCAKESNCDCVEFEEITITRLNSSTPNNN